MTTKLSLKLTSLAERKPAHAYELKTMAARLDNAKMALGNDLHYQSATYLAARKLYCKLTGRPWDWGQTHDLEDV